MKTLLLLHQVLFHEPEEVPLLINKGIVVGPGTFTAVAMRREKVCCILEQYDFEMLGLLFGLRKTNVRTNGHLFVFSILHLWMWAFREKEGRVKRHSNITKRVHLKTKEKKILMFQIFFSADPQTASTVQSFWAVILSGHQKGRLQVTFDPLSELLLHEKRLLAELFCRKNG